MARLELISRSLTTTLLPRRTAIRQPRGLSLTLLLVATSLFSGLVHDLVCRDVSWSSGCRVGEGDGASCADRWETRFEAVEEQREPGCPGCTLGSQRTSLERPPAVRRPGVASRLLALLETPLVALGARTSRTNRGPPTS